MASSRFPGKPLKLIAGFPIVQHVYFAAKAANKLDDVYVATDDEQIAETVLSFGGKVLMTSPEHNSGTDRIVEAVNQISAKEDSIIVNIQGDEPLVRPADIDRCVEAIISEKNADWATLIYKTDRNSNENNPNVVKVVCDFNGFALYFSRANIPYDRDGISPQRYAHIGLYVYKISALKRFAALNTTPLETAEKLEQLRALEAGMKIICVETEKAYPGIDTPEDFETVKKIISQNPELLNIK